MAVRSIGRGAPRRDSTRIIITVLACSTVLITTLILKGKSNVSSAVIEKPVVVAEFDTVLVPVPAASVPLGARGKDIKFKFVSFPKHQLPIGVITDLQKIMQAQAITSLPADLPIFESNFSTNAVFANPVVERIPAGMRAMTVRVDATTAVEGWAGSGAVVDVLLVTKDQTKVVAEKVKILSAERSVSPVEGQAAPSVPNTVTLLVTQEQCLAINTAIPLGKIAFALRSQQDEQAWNDTLFTADQLKGASSAKSSASQFTGYVALEGENKKFAFTEGKWVKTDSAPVGFRVGEK